MQWIETENWPHNSFAWPFSYYCPFPKASPGPVALISWPLLLSWHSHGTRKDLWSCYHAVICWHRTRSWLFSGPQEKLEKQVATISEFLTRKKVTLKEIQSLTSLLNFAWSVVVPGRAFLRRLIDLTLGIRFRYHFIRLTKKVKLDLQLWQSFLINSNGRAFFLEDTCSNSDLHGQQFFSSICMKFIFIILMLSLVCLPLLMVIVVLHFLWVGQTSWF